MVVALPIAAVMLGLAYLLLTRAVLPFSADFADTRNTAVADMLAEMGPISAPEKRVAAVFTAVALAWILYPVIGPWIGLDLTDTGVAIAGAVVLFVVPAGSKGTFLLDWATARNMPWEVLILFGGGLSLAEAIDSTGLAAWMGASLSFLHGAHLILIVGGISLLLVYMTELMSNTATAAAFLPVAGSLALASGVDPRWVGVAVALAASSAYMLPVATLPNAIVFGTGYVSLAQMIRAGFWLSFIGAFVITAGIAIAASLV
jgi:sodium-dependent dicarboxylate transporter 2/3/5